MLTAFSPVYPVFYLARLLFAGGVRDVRASQAAKPACSCLPSAFRASHSHSVMDCVTKPLSPPQRPAHEGFV